MAAPSNSANVVSTLNGLFKEVYGDKIAQLVPVGTKLQHKIPFASKNKEIGNLYHQPVLLAYEQGFTFLGASAGVVTLANAVSGVMKDAQIAGSQLILRAQMDYETAARAAKGRNSFVDSTGLMFESMQKSMRKKVEAELFYGGVGIATVGSIASNTITITAAEFAPGIWAGSEGAQLDGRHSGATVSMTIQSVDLVAGTVTVDSVGTLAAGDVLYFGGAFGSEMAGLHQILTNTGSLFNINAGTYNLWQATSYSAGSAALNLTKVNTAVAQAVGKGLDEDCTLYVNPKTWGNLLNDMASQRRFPESISSGGDNGAKAIEFYSQNGKITIEPSIYVKQGYAYGVSHENFKRIGASDVTFKTPGNGDQIFFHLPNSNGFEARCYTDQALLCEMPGKQFVITGIINS